MSYYHEARKHERNIRKISKTNKDRAERRNAYLARQAKDPQSGLLVQGHRHKVTRECSETIFQVERALVPWQGRQDTLIDRFDARAHLDILPAGGEVGNESDQEGKKHQSLLKHTEKRPDDEPRQTYCLLNYERYRGVIEAFRAGLDEEDQLDKASEEIRTTLFGQTELFKEFKDVGPEEKRKPKEIEKYGVEGHYGPSTAAGQYSTLGFCYPSGGSFPATSGGKVAPELDQEILAMLSSGSSLEDSSEEEEEGFEDIISDLEEDDLDISENEVEHFAEDYGISAKKAGYGYSRLLRYERRQKETMRARRAAEEASSTRKKKSRRQRRILREQLMQVRERRRAIRADQGRQRRDREGSRSKPSYGVRGSPTYQDYDDPWAERRRRHRDRRSKGPEAGSGGGRQYITCFTSNDAQTHKKSGQSGSHSGCEDKDSSSGEEDGPTHLELMEMFFPAVAEALRDKAADEGSDCGRNSEKKSHGEGNSSKSRRSGQASSSPEHMETETKPIALGRGTQAWLKRLAEAKRKKQKELLEKKELTPAERLKLKMRKALHKTVQKDKEQELRKQEEAEKDRRAAEREAEAARAVRAKQRELQHREERRQRRLLRKELGLSDESSASSSRSRSARRRLRSDSMDRYELSAGSPPRAHLLTKTRVSRSREKDSEPRSRNSRYSSRRSRSRSSPNSRNRSRSRTRSRHRVRRSHSRSSSCMQQSRPSYRRSRSPPARRYQRSRSRSFSNNRRRY